MTDKNLKEKIHDAAQNIKEKGAELKGEMKVKAQNAKQNLEKGVDNAKLKAAELKGEMKEHKADFDKKMNDKKNKIAKDE